LSRDHETVVEPFFMQGARGRLFCLWLSPPPGVAVRGAVLLIPPFAEEMNKSRRQLTLQARAFAQSGFRVLLLDLYGTGDSEGDFADARWETWIEDLVSAATWLQSHGAEGLTLVGLRLGAVLAAELAQRLPRPPERLILWQPVITGRQHVDQFLRLRVAANVLGNGDGVTVRAIRESLIDRQSVEVAGYELTADAVKQIDARDLLQLTPSSSIHVDWVEIVRSKERGVAPASQRLIEAWRERSADVRTELVIGESFWSTVEIVVVPELIEQTTRLVEKAA
jgi:exosortase A-associated hydrolase 2